MFHFEKSYTKCNGDNIPRPFSILKKNIYFVIFYYLTKCHCLVAFTSRDIMQYVWRKGFHWSKYSNFFLEGERPTLRTFNNYIIIMTNNSDKIRILWVWCFSSVAYFWVNSAGCSGEFNVFKHFGNLENLILNILKLKK